MYIFNVEQLNCSRYCKRSLFFCAIKPTIINNIIQMMHKRLKVNSGGPKSEIFSFLAKELGFAIQSKSLPWI